MQVYFCHMQNRILLICLLLANFGLLLGQERKVFFFSESPISYHQTSAERLVIDSFPTEGGWVNFAWEADSLSKYIPAGEQNMKYQVSRGNRGEAGVWFRPLNTESNQNFTSVVYKEGYVPENRLRLLPRTIEPADTLMAMVEETQVQNEEEITLANDEGFDVDSDEEESTEEVVSLVEEKGDDEEESYADIWEKAAAADFEFDRMRILREYLKTNGCEAEDVSKSLGILKYDPSRLELLRALSESCPEQIKPHLPTWSEEFFIYPQFRSQVIQLL